MEKEQPPPYNPYPPGPPGYGSGSTPPYPQQPINHQPPPVGFVTSPQGPPPHITSATIGIAIPQTTLLNYGPNPQEVICPHCHAQIRTSTRVEATTRTHMAALIMFCCLCWPCACLPYCMDSCQNTNHYCPNCRAFLGTYAS